MSVKCSARSKNGCGIITIQVIAGTYSAKSGAPLTDEEKTQRVSHPIVWIPITIATPYKYDPLLLARRLASERMKPRPR